MGRGSTIYLSYTALVLLSTFTTATAISDLWAVSIDEGPAPSPEDGPPFSAHASRDRSLLPYQIGGIIGSYVGSVLIIGTLLLTVGRSLRKRAQEMAARPTEMVKPLTRHFDPSPISPASSRCWYSPRKLRPKKSTTSSIRSLRTPISPDVQSITSFDNAVIESDRQKRQDEMERLYAAVMIQDERRSRHASPEIPSGAPPEYSRKSPPRLMTDSPALRRLQVSNQQGAWPPSPMTPKSPIRAIYPPGSPMPAMPTSPTSPIRAEYPSNYYSQPSEPRPTYETRSPSYGSNQSSSSTSKRKARKSLRNLKISSPMQGMRDDNSDGARTPLSPRIYIDPGIPPEPPTARTIDSQYPPTTPGTAKSWRQGDDYDNYEEDMDEIRDLPQPYPTRYVNDLPLRTDSASPSSPQAARPKKSAANVNNPLPFRQMHSEQRQQQAHPQFRPNPGTYPHPPSAGPVKTTFLETGRRGGFLGTPRTGMATPYSPYMPFTPLTPVTPHLMNRAERKQRLKDEQATRGALVEEERVQDERDVWGSGY